MKFIYKYGTRSGEVRRAKRELYVRIALVLAVVLFFLLMILVAKFRPRLDEAEAATLPDTAHVGDPMDNPHLIRLRAEVDALAATFRLRLEEEGATDEILQILENAIRIQRQVIRHRGSEIAPAADLDRLEELQVLYDEEMGAFRIAQSKRLQDEAEEAWEAGAYAEALQALIRARNLQQEVNDLYPRSSGKDPSRLHQLNNRILVWQTEPLALRADSLREEAFRLADEQRYGEAIQKMTEALEQQREINQDYRSSRFASLSRLKEFELAWRRIQVAEDTNRVAALVRESRAAMEEGAPERAQARAEEASILQRRVVSRLPGDEGRQMALLTEIEQLRDTAASLPAYETIVRLRNASREALRNMQIESFDALVAEWLRETERFLRTYPQSAFTNRLQEAEVRFLHSRKSVIPPVLEMVSRNLVPVPGHSGIELYRTEVPQALYSSVVGENPSNSRNPQHPVDSVTWEEAREFNRLMGWILARPVSLPTREIFVEAVGNMEAGELGERAWSRENADRETQPVASLEANDLGFYDLLGNVAEWLTASEEGLPDRVVAIGGAARDSRIRLSSIPEESREPLERNRFIGFRFVVQTAP